MIIKTYDVAIIGAGVIGCAIARELSRYDWQTLVLEENLEVGEAATKANSAIVHGGYDPLPGTLKAKLNVEGATMMPELAKLLDVPYQQIGSLVLAFNERDEAILEELLERGRQNGVTGLSIISRADVLTLEPNVSEAVVSALLCTTAGIICPFNLTYALIENAMANGVELKRDHKVSAIVQEEAGFLLKTNQGDIRTRLVINAAGVGADQIAALLSETDYEILPRKGEYRVLDKSERKMVHHVIFQTPTPLGKGILVTPTVYGNLMMGPNYLEATDQDSLIPSQAELEKIDHQAKKSVPGLNIDKTIRTFSGLRATLDSGDFRIYPSESHPGFFHVAGIDSPGLSSAPAIGKFVLDLVLESGLILDRPKTQFSRDRTWINVHSTRINKELAGKEAAHLDHETIICRCEGISEAQIRQAINRPAGAVTIDGVKRRVRAGMGRCQGTYCRSRVRKILAEELGIPEDQVPIDSKSRRGES